jgi:hypothetical protein
MSNHQTLVFGTRHVNPSFHGWLFKILFLFLSLCIDIQIVVISLQKKLSLSYDFENLEVIIKLRNTICFNLCLIENVSHKSNWIIVFG